MCLPGFHTYQRMIGCELLEDGSITGFLQYAYDGQDFLIFNKDTLSWMAMDNVADIIRRVWEANRHELQYQKNWLEEECPPESAESEEVKGSTEPGRVFPSWQQTRIKDLLFLQKLVLG